MLRRRDVIGGTILALIIACPLALRGANGETQEPMAPVASLEVKASRIDWLPKVDYERLDLTVAGPGNFYVRQEFKAGQAPQFSLVDYKGDRLPDGNYAYELRLVPRAGDDLAAELLVQSGNLLVQGGSFVDLQSVSRPSRPTGSPTKPLPRDFVTKDIVQNDDLVVKGHACIGPVCTVVNPGDPGLTLKEDFGGLLQIKFDADFCCHPTANDWALQANDGLDPNGPNGDFTIRNSSFSTIPFRIVGGSATPDNSLTVFINGNIGLGTRTPGAKLHMFGNATDDVFGSAGPDPVGSGPAFNFGYGGASFGRGAGFLNVRPDASATAPNPSLRFLTANVQRMIITNAGNVGIGTTNPAAKLEVSGGEVRFPPGAGAAGATHFNFAGDGKNYIRGTTIIADNAGSVGIGTTAPSSKLHVNGGDIRVSGGSFIDDGVTLNAPDYVFEPSYRLMPLEELRAFVAQEKHLPNVPNAREVKEGGLNLSQFQMRLLEKVEELTLYTLTQDQRLTSQQDELLRLREQNALLQQRLAALEKAYSADAPE